jgi:transcriptional regulator with XRE-family HTH domain
VPAHSKYRSFFPVLVKWMARNGLTAAQIADELHVSASTLGRWCVEHADLSDSLNDGRDLADARVEDSLFGSAIGGNVTAQIFWLKNRRPAKWRDVQRVEHLTVREQIAKLLSGDEIEEELQKIIEEGTE